MNNKIGTPLLLYVEIARVLEVIDEIPDSPVKPCGCILNDHTYYTLLDLKQIFKN